MPPGEIFDILIATAAFWVNLDNQLRAEILVILYTALLQLILF